MGGQSRQLLVRTHATESSRGPPPNARHGYGNPLRVSHKGRELACVFRGCPIYMALRIFPIGRWRLEARKAVLLVIPFAGLIGAPWQTAQSQSPFQIVWVVIGEAASATDKGSAHAGRQLFMASDLVSRSLANVKIEQVDVTPVISELAIGERLCLTAMNIRTLGPGREPVGEAPLSISVRQDHKQRLGLSRSKRDICVTPTDAGEYPLRLTSMLPANDGTMRGAQVFIRVRTTEDTDTTAADVE
jgi:hypothetical protein